MDQLKFYKYATWGLLFLNIAVLAFFLLTKPKPPRQFSPNNLQAEVIEILDLDSQQAAAFKKLAEAHGQKMRSINTQHQQSLLSYFESLTDTSKEMDKENVLNQLEELEGEKIEVTYQHFQDIKKLLNQEQLAHFEGLMRRLIDRVLLNQRRSSPPPKNSE